MNVLDELERLDKEATQGDWPQREGGSWESGKRTATEYFVMREGDDIAICADCLDPETGKPSAANAKLISAMRNALPSLLAAARAIEQLCYAPKHARPKRPMQALRAALAPLLEEVK